MALRWLIASVMNDPLGAPGMAPLYICLPPVWGAVGGDHQFLITCGIKMGTKNEKKLVF
jgi:hypothetical protein